MGDIMPYIIAQIMTGIPTKVWVDKDLSGIITAIHPNGAGQYIGKQHGYVWVAINVLNSGRAIGFFELERRLKIREN